jgi:hypothetical protein
MKKFSITLLITLAILGLIASGAWFALTFLSPVTPISDTSYGAAKPTSKCVEKNGMQDPKCTPGETISGVTAKQVCVKGYSSKVRNVPDSVKMSVKTDYGMTAACESYGSCEIDHLISLELGGSNEKINLWPEPDLTFHDKDKLENLLHTMVCKGQITLPEAQKEIIDWQNSLEKYGLNANE